MFPRVTGLVGAVPQRSLDRARLHMVLFSIAFTVSFSWLCAWWPQSDGRTAIWMDGINLLLLSGYAWRTGDRALGRLLLGAGSFGVVELLADFLCVRCTGTLDYGVSGSMRVLESPWWMPLSWAVVAVQMGVGGDAAIRRFGLVRGAVLSGLLGALLIPIYEKLAWAAHWWRYQHCLCVRHTPLYIVFAEAIIGMGLARLGYGTLRLCAPRAAIWLGVAAGLVTTVAGTMGWGLVEFVCRGAKPIWPFP